MYRSRIKKYNYLTPIQLYVRITAYAGTMNSPLSLSLEDIQEQEKFNKILLKELLQRLR
jgi:hypothetical protein